MKNDHWESRRGAGFIERRIQNEGFDNYRTGY